ncbi:MAG: DUF6750 family protein [Pseudomonadota bacterium]|nr:DUF6750 family protein [Pseudomonadota bacterium]
MKKLSKLAILIGLTACAYADIGGMAESINSTFSAISQLVGGAAYLFGLCFTCAGLFKFKQHRDNPQQVQLGSCFTLLGIGILLIFLPNLVSQAGETVFSSGTTTGGAAGTGFSDLGTSGSSS